MQAQRDNTGTTTNIYEQNNSNDQGIGPSGADDTPDYTGIADEVDANAVE